MELYTRIIEFVVLFNILISSNRIKFPWKKLVKCYIWSIALCGAETWAVDQKHLESFEMWCWRRMEKISWADYVRNEDVLLRVK
jgi:hypothetical protein